MSILCILNWIYINNWKKILFNITQNCINCKKNYLLYKNKNCLDCKYNNKYVNYEQNECIDSVPNRYYINDKIDLDYLQNFGYDNIPVLIELHEKTNDARIKEELDHYFVLMREHTENSIFEFNISKYRGLKLLEEDFK